MTDSNPPTFSLPTVSVGFITYNQVNFIREAVESALAQDYAAMDVFVTDDCSTDGTYELLQQLEQQHAPRLRVYSTGRNLGITGNSNFALQRATGDYICLIGGDDLLLPGKIRRQVEFMQAHPEAAVSYHEAEVFDSATGRVMYHYTGTNIHEGGVEQVIRHQFICAGTGMIERRSLPEGGFDPAIPVISDWMMWIDLLAQSGKQVLYFPGVYLRYRRHGANVSSPTSTGRVAYPEHLQVLRRAREKYPHLADDVAFKEMEFLTLSTIHNLRRRFWPDWSGTRASWRHLRHVPGALRAVVSGYLRSAAR